MQIQNPLIKAFQSLFAGVTGLLIMSACTVSRADEVVVGHLSVVPIESIKAAIPHKIKLTEKKPAVITAEPIYRGKPMYGTIVLGTSKKASVTVVLDTFPGDKLPKLYVDLAGSGDITSRAAMFLLRPLTDFTIDKTNTTTAAATSAPGAGIPLGAMAATVARYDIKGITDEVKCPVLFTVFGDELDYTISVQHLGTLNVAGKTFRIALVDANANAVFDGFMHADDKPANVNLMIDRNDDGKFDPVKERFDIAKPFRLAGTAYEVASVDPEGTIIALQSTTKRPEGGISADEMAIGTDSIDFIAKTMDGKTIAFPSSYKHRIVLLSFWATSDQASVAEIPAIVSTYGQLHNYGFDVLGVSLDKPNMAEAVTSFCGQSGMVWPEIYDGMRWNTAVAKLYGVDSLPRLFLIDGDTGTVLGIGEGLRGAALQATVTRMMQKKGMLRRR